MLRALVLLVLCAESWAACPSGSIFDQTFNRCYKYVTSPKGAAQAEQDCISIGGHLASIQNGFENALVAETATNYFGKVDYWIGATLSGSSFSWTDGSPFTYYNWAPGQPDKSQSCVSVSWLTLQWTTASCTTSTKPYVCVVPQEVPTTQAPCTTAQPTTSITQCSEGWAYFGLTQSCYKVFFNKDFNDAEKYCVAQYAHLASVHSVAENSFISSLSMTGLKLSAEEMTWIGLKKEKHEWKFTDGSATDYLNWAPNEPASLAIDGCVQLVSDEEKLHAKAYTMWRNVKCGATQRAFVCKKRSNY